MQHKVALVNSTEHTPKKPRLGGQTEPSFVAFYDLWPGNGKGLFFQRSQQGARVP